MGGAAAPSKTSYGRTEENKVSGKCLTYLQPGESTIGGEDKHDDFDLDEDIFDNIYTEDEIEHQTSELHRSRYVWLKRRTSL